MDPVWRSRTYFDNPPVAGFHKAIGRGHEHLIGKLRSDLIMAQCRTQRRIVTGPFSGERVLAPGGYPTKLPEVLLPGSLIARLIGRNFGTRRGGLGMRHRPDQNGERKRSER
jgi:hypothetical protein